MKLIKSTLLKYSPSAYFLLRDIYQLFGSVLRGDLKKMTFEAEAIVDGRSAYYFTQRWIKSYQIESEILGLLGLIDSKRPKTYMEIGTAEGGTSFLIRHVCKSIEKSVAIDTDIRNKYLLDRITGTQRSHYLRGYSTSKSVHAGFRKLFPQKQMLDVLFIDGDHTYEGVKADFDLYASEVKPGGLIILHDIVEDWGQRFGRQTNKFTGGVPKFYAEIKHDYEHNDFVDNSEQDGFGIGVIIQK